MNIELAHRPASPIVAGERALAVCRGVCVTYGELDARVDALNGVELSIEHGETVALWGRSGSGKTTLLHVLGGLVEPTAGTVEWQGAPLASLADRARGVRAAGGIAYVFQGSNLLPTFTAYENVAFGSWAADGDGGRGHDDVARSLLELVGLSAKVDLFPGELSGGEAQRVAIARAVAREPQLLLCDEPTGHLDSDTAERVLDLIDALQRRQGFALVVATHDADIAARADRQVVLADGFVVEGGR